MHNDIFRYIRTKQEANTVLAALHSISQDIFVGTASNAVSTKGNSASNAAAASSTGSTSTTSSTRNQKNALDTRDTLNLGARDTLKAGAGIEAVLQKYLSVEICQVLIDALAAEKTPQAKRQKLLEIIKKLDIDIRGFSAFTLTIAIIPTQKMVEHIYRAVESFLGSSVVLDIHYDPDMCAGAKIVWKGLYRDYSVASKIDKLFEKKREEIGEMVKGQ